jgi:hypothetical protein
MKKFDKIVESVLNESKEYAEDLANDHDGLKVVMEFETYEDHSGEFTNQKWPTGAPVTKKFKGSKTLKDGKYWGLATEGARTGMPIVYLYDKGTWYFFKEHPAKMIIGNNEHLDKTGALKELSSRFN